MKPILRTLLCLAVGLVLSAASQEPGAPVMSTKPKLTPCLWFGGDAEEAIRHYRSIFQDTKVLRETRWGPGGPFPEGRLMAATLQLAGQELVILNDAPCRFTEAISLMVHCESQREVDTYWDKLSAGGEPGQCGWLKDKFGLSWQVIPTVLPEMLGDEDPARARRVGEAMMQMGKLDIQRLRQAYEQR